MLSYVTTDGQSVSLSGNKAPTWSLRPDFYYCEAVAGLLMWGTDPTEKTASNSSSVGGCLSFAAVTSFGCYINVFNNFIS
jgi:hypothetical protein